MLFYRKHVTSKHRAITIALFLEVLKKAYIPNFTPCTLFSGGGSVTGKYGDIHRSVANCGYLFGVPGP